MNAEKLHEEISVCVKNILDNLDKEMDIIIIEDDDTEGNKLFRSNFLRSSTELLHQETSNPVHGTQRSLVIGQNSDSSYGIVFSKFVPFCDRTNQTMPSFSTPLQIVPTDVKNEQASLTSPVIGPLLPSGSLSNRIICPQNKNHSEPEVYASRLHKARINTTQRLADFLIKEKLNLQIQILEKSKELHVLKSQIKELIGLLKNKLNEGTLLIKEFFDTKDKAVKMLEVAQKLSKDNKSQN